MARPFGKSKMTPAGPVKLSDEDRITRLEGLLAEQAQVLDAQTGVIVSLREQLAERALQTTFIMRIMKRVRKKAVLIQGMPDTEELTLEQLYWEQRDELLATLLREATAEQEKTNGEGVSTNAGDTQDGNQAALDDAAAARPRFSGPTRH